jgi:hypothetical protein
MRFCQRFILYCVLAFIPCIYLQSQPILFYVEENWSSASFAPFIDGKDVKGYSAVYYHQLLVKEYEYSLEILNENFKSVSEAKFRIPFTSRVKHSSFNGKAVCVTLESLSGVLIENLVLNTDGNLLARYPIGKKGMLANSKMFGVPGVGFIGYVSAGSEPNIVMRKNNGDIVWTISPDATLKEKINVHYVDTKHLLTRCELAGVKPEGSDGMPKVFYRLYDVSNGNKVCDLIKKDTSRVLMPFGATMGEHGNTVFGQFYNADKSFLGFDGKTSLGFYLHEFNANGDLLKEKYLSWADDISPLLLENDDTRDTSIWLHELMVGPTGRYYLLGELYHYSNGSGIDDAIVFELDDRFNLTNVHRFPKYQNKVPIGAEQANDYLFGENLFEAKSFGYKYGSHTSDKSAFSFVYTNLNEREKKEDRFYVGAIGFNRDRELVQSSFPLKSLPKSIKVLPAKNGYAAVIEYHYDKFTGVLNFYKLDL